MVFANNFSQFHLTHILLDIGRIKNLWVMPSDNRLFFVVDDVLLPFPPRHRNDGVIVLELFLAELRIHNDGFGHPCR